MDRATFRGGWVAAAVAISLLLLSSAETAAQKRHHDSRPRPATTAPTNAILIDGTPRPAPVSAPPAPPAGRLERWTPPAPGERTPNSLQTINDHPGMASALGGDDVLIASFPTPVVSWGIWLQVTSDGRLFAAALSTWSPGQMDIYRSLDGGDTWTLWSSFAPGFNARLRDFTVAQGDADQALIAYLDWNGSTTDARVARADLNTDTPVWSVVTAIEDPAINVTSGVAFDTDAWGFSNYYIYLVAVADDGNGRDVWFSVSYDLGVTFEPETKIADTSDGSWGFLTASITTGYSGYVHASMTRDGTLDAGEFYRRTVDYGTTWDPLLTIDAVDNGTENYLDSVAASRTNDNVLLLFNRGGSNWCRYSTDAGVTWPPANDVPTGYEYCHGRHVAFPGSELVIGGYTFGGLTDERYKLSRSVTGSPAALAAPQELSISTTDFLGTETAIVTDPSRGNRIAAVWFSYDATNTYLRFDAEWRRDFGYPNTDIGFPIAVQGGGQTPPAVAEVDGDPEKEIVFATLSGDVHVVNHDGTAVPGWPVNIGAIPFDAPVAVGDLVGNGDPVVVAGNGSGEVYAFDATGALLPGWPVDLGTGTGVYVSIGTLGPPSTRYVVALSNRTVAILDNSGTNVAPAWVPAEIPFGVYSRPAAIGDADNDGVTDIVSLAGPNVYYHSLNSPNFSGQQFTGVTFSDAPTMADIDLDGILEIAAPTSDGKMYLFHKAGPSFSTAWPITVSPGVALTSAAFGNILGTQEPELVFAEAGGNVHVRYSTGVEQSGYPLASGSSFLFMPPILSPVNIFVSNVNIGTTDGVNGTGQSWRNLGMVPDGWPRNLPGPVEETFASGDIDNDGRNELVVLGVDFLSVYDVGEPPTTNPRNHWPMYGYDAQRTGCLACDEILTAVGDTPADGYNAALSVHPNPFNPVTTIEYEVARAGLVSLEVFDVSGRRVATLIAGEHREAGRYSVSYTATGASGVYFARLQTADGEVARKIVLLK
ncbi:MAG: T9SS type A sorting domain-containing protein [Candidatus Krumholzibacteria bacterium]|nr:T9SS type A sorting domain-containing protein [Candidatus Krumholzibacteria bacterium]